MVMRWRTYTPDGRMLEIDHADGEWIAKCEGASASASTASAALHEALRESASPIGSSAYVLAAWIEEQASSLEREAASGA
jgi:hypothetical protein